MMAKRSWTKAVLVASLGLGLAAGTASLAADSAEQTLARQILDAAGVTGGLVVHLGCGGPPAGGLTAALRADNGYLVQGLDTDRKKVGPLAVIFSPLACMASCRRQPICGRRFALCRQPRESPRREAARRPSTARNTARAGPQRRCVLKTGGGWTKIVKPRPAQMDEWTHYLHDAGGNAVSHDTMVAPPQHLQWVGSPAWTRHHDNMSSFNAMVAANGRVFYIMDEGLRAEIQMPPQWIVTRGMPSMARSCGGGKSMTGTRTSGRPRAARPNCRAGLSP